VSLVSVAMGTRRQSFCGGGSNRSAVVRDQHEDGEVDVDRCSREDGRCCERKLSSQHFAAIELTAAPHLNGSSDSTFGK
jgi:hypothetical protein